MSWPRPDPAEFHLKLIAAAADRPGDPLAALDLGYRESVSRTRATAPRA